MGLANADVAGQGELQPATHGVAVYGGNADAPEGGQSFKGAAEVLGHASGYPFVAVCEQVEVRPGGEELLPGTGDDDGVNVRIVVGLFDHRLKSA